MMEWEDWVRLGAHLKDATKLIRKGHGLNPRPKSKAGKWITAQNQMVRLKSALEDLVCDEHPEMADATHVFYGPRELGGQENMTIPGADKWSRVPGQDVAWEIDDAGVYLVSGGRRWSLKELTVVANGTRELCIAKDGKGELIIAKAAETPPEMVVGVPDADIAIFEFHEEIPALGGDRLMVGLNPTFDRLIMLMVQRFPALKTGLYDAYLGKDYGADQ